MFARDIVQLQQITMSHRLQKLTHLLQPTSHHHIAICGVAHLRFRLRSRLEFHK